MNQIENPPSSVTQAGLGFNYETWTAGTEILMCNVPWNNDYRDIVKFDNRAALDTYLESASGPKITFTATSYAKPNVPIRVNIPFNAAMRYNYLRVENPLQPISGDTIRTYYYFVTGVSYVSPSTTEITIQLDVWQTFFTDIQLGRAYIERGHIGIANTNANDRNGREFLTVSEGLDLGGEYLIQDTETVQIGDNGTDNGASVVVVSTVDFSQSGGTTDSPVMVSASGQSSINGVPSGADVYFFESSTHFSAFLDYHKDRPWITQGIIAAYLIPGLTGASVQGVKRGIGSTGIQYTQVTGYQKSYSVTVAQNWRARMQALIPSRWRHLTKFLTYPYSFIELTMYNGKPLVIKPEALWSSNPHFQLSVKQMLTPPNPRLMIVPTGYNRGNSAQGVDAGDYLDFATGITNLPQLSVVNNMYMNYLASNANNIDFQHINADWSQQRALNAAATSYDQATNAIDTASRSTSASNLGATQQMLQANETANYQMWSQGAQGAVTNLGAGNALGAAVSVAGSIANYGIQTNQNTQSTNIRNRTQRHLTNIANSQTGFVRDTNKDLADWAARGDYSNTIAGINAKIQDAKMIQPTVSGQIGGEAFTFSIMDGFKVRANFKFVDYNVMQIIGDYWLRYGYAVNRYVNVTNLNLMSNFTYWKMKELYITAGAVPETFKQSIRGIFEKGVTVWRHPAFMTELDVANNTVTNGVAL